MTKGNYCYPGSETLINKYDIRNKDLLDKFEIQKVAVKLIGLDARPERIVSGFDVKCLTDVHRYLFGDLYEWAGAFRDENLYKSERVLSGASAEYADYQDIPVKLQVSFKHYKNLINLAGEALVDAVSDFLLELWSIHPFREGNTRTCITFLWHYLNKHGIDFRVELLRNNPMYVRDALVMANYDEKDYLKKIISDALLPQSADKLYCAYEERAREQYQIAKADYEAFRNKYLVK